MKSTGIHRKVDDLGRIVIPAGLRRTLGINEGDALEVLVDGDRVVLAKPSDSCVFCGSDTDLEPFRDKVVCRPCVGGLGEIDGRLNATEPQRPVRPVDDEDPAPGSGFEERYRPRQDPYDPASTTAW